jgi:hypothetical protein
MLWKLKWDGITAYLASTNAVNFYYYIHIKGSVSSVGRLLISFQAPANANIEEMCKDPLI